MNVNAKRLIDALGSWSTRPGVLHERLTGSIQEAVRQGSVYPGMRLPAERHLASLLAVSRTTVVTSYNELRANGWAESRVGSGTWITRKKATQMRASAHASQVARSPLLNMLQAPETGAIDFATSTPSPLSQLILPMLGRIESHAAALLSERDYMPFGLPALREAVAAYCSANGTPTVGDEVLITTGGQQAISLICQLLLQRGDHVLVENPTYHGALEAFRVAGARLIALPICKEHVRARALRQRVSAVSPRLIYLTPTGQNPTGMLMPESVRSEIAHGTEEHGVNIVEDEVLADLTLVGKRPRSIASFVQNANVLTIGSLSKLFWPSLRVGWVRGPKALIGRLARLKTAIDLGSALLPQEIAVDLLGIVPAAREARRKELTPKRDHLAKLLREHLPAASFSVPKAGLCIWVQLPHMDSQLVSQAALRRGLVLPHGGLFSVDEAHGDYVRIPFVLEMEVLERGVRSLASAVKDLEESVRVISSPLIALT
jgi:DNA-binding transcriptional MocR family regulator